MRKHQNIFINAKVIFRCGDMVLYYRNDRDGYIGLPGGHLEWGESPLAALRRELREEFDYSLQGEPELFTVTSYVPPDQAYHRVRIVYRQDLPKPVQLTWVETDEPVIAHWIHQADIPRAELPPHLKEILLKALER